jgi:nucleolar protein 9
VARSRFNVLKTLFERCAARNLQDEIKLLMKGLKEGCGYDSKNLVTMLCCLKEKEEKKTIEQITKNDYAVQSNGAQLLLTLLAMQGPNKAVQESLLALPDYLILRLATTSMPTVNVLVTALATPSANPAFHKSLVNIIIPHIPDLATSQYGHNLINEIAQIPSRGKERSVPPHMKEVIMTTLGQHEAELRESWMGRSVWKTWKGDMWKTRRGDWKFWIKEVGAEQSNGGSATGSGPRGKQYVKNAETDKSKQDNKNKEEGSEKEERKKKKKKKKNAEKASKSADVEE